MSNLENPISKLFKCLSISILFMFIGYIVGLNFVPAGFIYLANKILVFLMTGLVIMAIFSKKIIPRRFSMNYVYLFTFIDGILISPVIAYYVGSLGSGIVINVLIATMGIFATLSFVSMKDKEGKYLKLGPILFASLIGLFIMSLLNFVFYGKVFNILVSVFGVIVFSGYILYDVSVIKYEIENGIITDVNDLSIHVLNLYVDFINIFMDLLRIVKELND